MYKKYMKMLKLIQEKVDQKSGFLTKPGNNNIIRIIQRCCKGVFNMRVRTRFAPSPTGYMHIGNLRSALYEYLIAKRYNGDFILRIEDTDQNRYVEGALDVIYKTLKIAGIRHDEGPDVGGDYGPYVQSERKHIYLPYARQLVEQGDAYYCFCTKERLENLKKECEAQGKTFRYDRHCRNLPPDEVKKRLDTGESYVIRQKMPETGSTSFEDVVYGSITIDNSELEDQILIKSDGLPTYNFANVIDDHLMGITHVARGCEYLTSTPKYNLLYKAFGWDIPTYVHLPLINTPEGRKLSKRAGDPSFEDLLEMGYLPEAIINYVALLGWSPKDNREFFTLKELEEVFDITGISKSPAVFDIKKLTWMNGEYIRKMSLEDFHNLAMPYYKRVITRDDLNFRKLSEVLQKRTEVLNTIPETVTFLEQLPEYDISLYIHKKMKTDYDISLKSLEAVYNRLSKLEDWSEDTLHNVLVSLAEEMGYKNGQVMWPVRTALSGLAVSPGGAVELANILGKAESLKRMETGIEKLKSA